MEITFKGLGTISDHNNTVIRVLSENHREFWINKMFEATDFNETLIELFLHSSKWVITLTILPHLIITVRRTLSLGKNIFTTFDFFLIFEHAAF